MTDLSGKWTLITGASKGIGRAIAESLAQKGCNVAINYRTDKAGAEETQSRVKKYGIQTLTLCFDVTDEDSIKTATKTLKERGITIDILVNNAGIALDGLLLMQKSEQIKRSIDTNLLGPILVTKYFLRDMLKKGWGRIINIGSVVGLSGNAGQTAYASAKAGLVGFTKSLAKEVAKKGITVNYIAPGYFETDMTGSLPETTKESILASIPMARPGNPEEVGSLCAFLASDDGAYITGKIIGIDGGMYI